MRGTDVHLKNYGVAPLQLYSHSLQTELIEESFPQTLVTAMNYPGQTQSVVVAQ